MRRSRFAGAASGPRLAHERLLSGAVLLWLCCHRNASWRRLAGGTFNLASRIEEKILREIGDQIALRSLDLSSSAPTTETREIERFSVRGRTAGGTDTFGSIIAIIGRILTQPRKNQFPVCTRVFLIANKAPPSPPPPPPKRSEKKIAKRPMK